MSSGSGGGNSRAQQQQHWEDEVHSPVAPVVCELHEDRQLSNRARLRRGLDEAVIAFNQHGYKAALSLLRGLIDVNDPQQVASFVFFVPGLNKREVGKVLGGPSHFSKAALRHFMHLFQFKGVELTEALRVLFSKFHPPGEAQELFRVVSEFAAAFVRDNADDTLPRPSGEGTTVNESALSPPLTADNVAFLTYAILMLHTDRHNSKVRRKMAKSEFLKLFASSKIDEPDNAFRREALSKIYDDICDSEFRVLFSDTDLVYDRLSAVLNPSAPFLPGNTQQTEQQLPLTDVVNKRAVVERGRVNFTAAETSGDAPALLKTASTALTGSTLCSSTQQRSLKETQGQAAAVLRSSKRSSSQDRSNQGRSSSHGRPSTRLSGGNGVVSLILIRPEVLYEKTTFFKYCRSGAIKIRLVFLDETRQWLRWSHQSGGGVSSSSYAPPRRAINLREILDVTLGTQCSPTFKKFRVPAAMELRCCSVHTAYRTLDLCAPLDLSPPLEIWATTLLYVCSLARRRQQQQHSAASPPKELIESGEHSKRRRSSVPPNRCRVSEQSQEAAPPDSHVNYHSDSALCRRRQLSRTRHCALMSSSEDEVDADCVAINSSFCGCFRRVRQHHHGVRAGRKTSSHHRNAMHRSDDEGTSVAKLIMNTWQNDIIPSFALHYTRGLCELGNKRLESPAFLRFMPPPSNRAPPPSGGSTTRRHTPRDGANFASTSSQSFIPMSQSYWRLQPDDASTARSGHQPTSASRRAPSSQSALSSRPSEPPASCYYNEGPGATASLQLSTSFAARLDWIRSLWSREQESFLKLMTCGIRVPCASEPSNIASELRDLRTTSAAGTLCESFADGPSAYPESTQQTVADDGDSKAAVGDYDDEHLMLFEPACYWTPDLLALPEPVQTHLTSRGRLREDRQLFDQLARMFQLKQDHILASVEFSPILRHFSLNLLGLWWVGLPEHLRPFLWEKALCNRIEHQHYDPTLHDLITTAIRNHSPLEKTATSNPFRRLFNHHSRINLSELCRAIADKPSLLFKGHSGWLPLAIAEQVQQTDDENSFSPQNLPGLWQTGMSAVSQTLRSRVFGGGCRGNTVQFDSSCCWICAEFERHMLVRAAALNCSACAADAAANSNSRAPTGPLPLLRTSSHRARSNNCHPCCPRCLLLHERVSSCEGGKRSTRCATIMVAGCLTTGLGVTSTLSSHLMQLIAFVCAHTADCQRALRLVTELIRNPKLPIREFLTTGSEYGPRRQRQIIGWLQLFQSCFAIKLPLLYQHFKALELGPEFYVPRLFASLFLSHLPLACASAVWDRLLATQTAQCAIEVTLGLLKYLELLLLTSSFSGCLAILSYSYFTEMPIFTQAETPSQAASPWLSASSNALDASRLISEFDDARFWRCVGYCELDGRISAWWTNAVDGHLESLLLLPILDDLQQGGRGV